jgi:hypothetical protein
MPINELLNMRCMDVLAILDAPSTKTLIKMRSLPDPFARHIAGNTLRVKPPAEPVHQWTEWWQAISSNRTGATKKNL